MYHVIGGHPEGPPPLASSSISRNQVGSSGHLLSPAGSPDLHACSWPTTDPCLKTIRPGAHPCPCCSFHLQGLRPSRFSMALDFPCSDPLPPPSAPESCSPLCALRADGPTAAKIPLCPRLLQMVLSPPALVEICLWGHAHCLVSCRASTTSCLAWEMW